MKHLIFIIFSLIILTSSPGQLPTCNLTTAKQAIPPRIFADTTIDGPLQSTIITRFFHNKPGIYGSEISKCYFNAIDPVFIFKSIGIIGLLSLIYFTYRAAIFRNWLALTILLITPLIPFFNLPLVIMIIIYKVFAIIGLAQILKVLKSKAQNV